MRRETFIVVVVALLSSACGSRSDSTSDVAPPKPRAASMPGDLTTNVGSAPIELVVSDGWKASYAAELAVLEPLVSLRMFPEDWPALPRRATC